MANTFSRATDRIPPLRKPPNWKDDSDDFYPASAPVTAQPFASSQYNCFQSTTILRSVPIMRRHLDNFGGRTYSLPAKTKAVPFHTGRFIFDPAHPPIFLEELTQNQRLQAEIAMIDKVRKLKRKREALGQRWDWRVFRLSGSEMSRGERFNLHAEVQKLKELVLPPRARDIYTGRGIRLPQTHHTVRPTRRTSPDEPYLHQPSAWATIPDPPPSVNLARSYQSQSKLTGPLPPPSDRPPYPPSFTSQYRPELDAGNVSSSAVPTSSPNITQEHTVKGDDYAISGAPASNIPSMVKEQESVDPIDPVQPDEQSANNGDPIKSEDPNKTEVATPTIAATPIDRSRSMAAPSASPDARTQSNPLISVSALNDSIVTEEENERLKQSFNQMVDEEKGHLSFEKMLDAIPSSSSLTENQRRFLRSFYDLVTTNQPFGQDDFMALTVLSDKMSHLSSSVQEMFEQINFAELDESIMQYTELFGSVDRNARGRIGVEALLQLLSTTLHRQLESDARLTKQILETIGKKSSDDISRLEFLSFVPYFLYLEEMT